MEKLVSIIVPVHNKATFLPTCLDSLVSLHIDKKLIEVICVDDHSSDGSLEIIQAYANNYPFIKVIALHENTGSPSHPRNVGLKEAQATYLTLLDADDWLDKEGFPRLIFQMEENDADIGFGQSYKHTDKRIRKIAPFASYKKANHLIPYKIERIFRAVGPPGKVFKRSIVMNHHITFEHMLFGEDKLFFMELISTCQNASMTNEVVYHVNRYEENTSLVTETSMLEKAAINLKLLKKIMTLKVTEEAQHAILSRMIEVDFMQRFFHTKTFLKSLEKDTYYNIFSDVVQLFVENDLHIENYIHRNRFKNIYYLYCQHKSELETYLEYLVDNKKKSFYVKGNTIHQKFPDAFSHLHEITKECFAVYGGTHFLHGEFYEVINVYQETQVKINAVCMSKPFDETIQQEVPYQMEGNTIYIRTDDLQFEGDEMNLRIIFNGFKSTLVNTTLPSTSKYYQQKSQDTKVIFKSVTDKSLLPADDYISVVPRYVVALKDIRVYLEADFQHVLPEKIKAGTRIAISEIIKSKRGTPRLRTKEGYVITSNKKFVKELTDESMSGYVFEIPKKVKITKKCKVYETTSFKTAPVRTLEPGEIMMVQDIVYTPKQTPRLKIEDNHYITANLQFVEVIA